MPSVQSITKGKKTTFSHLSDVYAFNYGNLIHVTPNRYDTEDSIKSGKRARRAVQLAVSAALEVKIKGRETQLPSEVFDEQQKQIKLNSIPNK